MNDAVAFLVRTSSKAYIGAMKGIGVDMQRMLLINTPMAHGRAA